MSTTFRPYSESEALRSDRSAGDRKRHREKLRRSIRDIRALGPLEPNVRLVKGIYVEPALIAYQDYEEVRSNFVRCLRELLRGGSYVAIATHDQYLLDEVGGGRGRRS